MHRLDRILRGASILIYLICSPAGLSQSESKSFQEGIEAFRRRDFIHAERALREVVKNYPAHAEAQFALGVTYLAQKKLSLAEDPLAKACAIDPAGTTACLNLGELYHAFGRFEKAEESFHRSLVHGDRPADSLYGLAKTAEVLRRHADADRFYKKAIEAGQKQAATDYGLFLFKQGRGTDSKAILREAGADAALARIEKALHHWPKGDRASDELAIVSFRPQALDMVVRNGASGNKQLVETMIGGVAVFDYNADDWPDVYICNGAAVPSLKKEKPSYHNRLFRNNQDGTFTDVTQEARVMGEGYSMGVAAGDYDNDGWVDLFVTGVRINVLYRNRGDGTFEDVTRHADLQSDGRWSVAAGWFDFDNDGWLDLFLVRYVVWDSELETVCGDPKGTYRTYCHPRHYGPLPNMLYRNQGDGAFRDVSQKSGIGDHLGKGMSLAFGNYDGDNYADIFVTNDTGPDFLFRNKGDGTFQEIGVPAAVAYNGDGRTLSSMGVDFRDYDNDGRDDLFVTALSRDTFPLFRNVGDDSFVDLTHPSHIGSASFPYTGWGAGMFDLNNDGFKDIFVANGHVLDNADAVSDQQSRQPSLVFINRADGTFQSVKLPGDGFHRGAGFGDLNRDGRIDIVVTRLNEKPLVLWNTTPGEQHWIGFRLVGAGSNRDGIGSRVHIATESGEQWNHVTTAVGYASSSDRLVHFGLGRDKDVKNVEITWPSGAVQTLRELPADRYVAIEESQ